MLLFRLYQSLCRRIQAEGLQVQYYNLDKLGIKLATLALFVPLEKVELTFESLTELEPEGTEYFELLNKVTINILSAHTYSRIILL